MAWRKIFSTYSWKPSPCGASRKSAKKALGRGALASAAPPGGVTVTSFRLPGDNVGVTPQRIVGSTRLLTADAPPRVRSSPATKPPPKTLIAMRPAAGPDAGETELTDI